MTAYSYSKLHMKLEHFLFIQETTNSMLKSKWQQFLDTHIEADKQITIIKNTRLLY